MIIGTWWSDSNIELVEIKSINKHYEVYKDGEFWCSADTRHEAEQDKEEVEAEKEDGE